MSFITFTHYTNFLVSITNVEAIEGQSTSLFCPLTTPTADKINMVLWFKNNDGIPLYR